MSRSVETEKNTRKFPWKAVTKWTLFVIVFFFVIRYGYRQWVRADLSEITLSPGWVIVSGVVYMLSWLPAGWIWWILLRQAGEKQLPFYPTLRAHFCGHLGKYAPGKALALVIRATMLRDFHVRPSLAAVLATVETLLTMATALLMLVILFPLMVGGRQTAELTRLLPFLKPVVAWDFQTQLLASGALVVLALLLVPLFAWLFSKLINRISWRLARRKQRLMVAELEAESGGNLPKSEWPPLDLTPVRLTSGTFLMSILASSVGWILNGVSLGCLLQGLGVSPESMADPALWISAVAGATALGFLVLFAPGGLGVREAALVAMLQLSPQIDVTLAVIVAFLLRLISFSSEVVFAGLFYVVVPRKSSTDAASDETGPVEES